MLLAAATWVGAVDAAAAESGASGLTVSDLRVVEGDGGDHPAIFTVRLSAPVEHAVSVSFATSDGTAVSSTDYEARSGRITFPAGTTTKAIHVTTRADLTSEADETFDLTLSDASGAAIADAVGRATIANNDGFPALSIADITVNEGHSGSRRARFTFTLSHPTSTHASVRYRTSPETVDEPAANPGSDYIHTSGTLTFAPGSDSAYVDVEVLADGNSEGSEIFWMEAFDAVGLGLVGGWKPFASMFATAAAWIRDEPNLDLPVDVDGPSLSIGDVLGVHEADAGSPLAYLAVTLDTPATSAVSVDYATSDGTASAPDDYAATAGTLTFAPGARTRFVAVPIRGDLVREGGQETLTVQLSNSIGANVRDGVGEVRIYDYNRIPSWRGSHLTVAEGDAGTSGVPVTISLSSPLNEQVTLNYEAKAPSPADPTVPATPGSDFVAKSGTVTFEPGEFWKSVTVQIHGDTTPEPGELLYVTFRQGTQGIASSTITILDG